MVTAPPADDMQLILARAEQIQDAGYAQFVCQRSYRYYAERVKQLGFANLGVVADVGCGYGQWSAALAEVNEAVIGLDLHHGRLGIGRAFAESLQLKNVDFARANGLKLPLADESVDGLFCYGVFMFMDRRLALDEFRRVLKPGGKLYVCTNGLGWWLQLWIKHLRGNEHVRRSAWQAMVRGKQNTPPHSTSRRQVAAMLGAEHWGEIIADYEGCLGCYDRIRSEPFYQGSYWGCDSVIEFTAVRKPHTPAEVRQSLETEIAPALQDTRYNYHTQMRRYPQPSPAADLVNNCDQRLVQRICRQARTLDRVAELRRLFARLTQGISEPREQVMRCLTFAQRQFYHHFAGQPMQRTNLSVLCPLAGLMLGFGRCGTVARFLIDLFECNGLPARLLLGACHTSAEVLVNDRWVLVDASLYPPGIAPRNAERDLLSLDEAAHDPHTLDRCPSYINYHHEYIDAFLREYPEADAPIGKYLRAPVLPSTGFFGREFFERSGRTPGLIERHRKLGTPEDWSRDDNFGWLSGAEVTKLQALATPTIQRPEQVKQVWRSGDKLCWARPYTCDPTQAIRYRIITRQTPRAWSYDQLPNGCNFAVEGTEQVSAYESIAWDKLRGGQWLTIVAEIDQPSAREWFYLPSVEFDLANVESSTCVPAPHWVGGRVTSA